MYQRKRIKYWSKINSQIEFIEQLQNDDGENADGIKSMFVLTVLEKVKQTRIKFCQGTVTAL